MSGKNKQKVLIIWLSLLLLPFVLLTDLFPFMRFGMFAEPVVHSVQREKLEVFTSGNNGIERFNSIEIDINPNSFFYLCRNYYYRNESEVLLERVSKLSDESKHTFYLYKIILQENPAENDTIIVASYKK